MISSDTPYKLAEIIRDTYPQLFYLKPMKFTVYSKNGCPYCTKVCSALSLADVQFIEYKLERDYTREEFYDKFGVGATFPKVTRGDTIIGGCKETVSYLREQKLI